MDHYKAPHQLGKASIPFMLQQVVGWGGDVEELATGLAEFAVDGTLVTVISSERPQGLPEALRGCTFQHVEGSPTSFSSFHQAGLADCDSLLLGGPLPPPPHTPLPSPASFSLDPNPHFITLSSGPHLPRTAQGCTPLIFPPLYGLLHLLTYRP